MKVIKLNYYPDIEIEIGKSNIKPYPEIVTITQDTETGIIIERKKIAELIDYLTKLKDAN